MVSDLTLLSLLDVQQAPPHRAGAEPHSWPREVLAPASVAGDPVLSEPEAALAELYERYSAMVFAVASRVLRDKRDAEEVLQDVFLSLWRTAGRYDPDLGSLGTYLLTLTRNASLSRLRARAARAQVLDDDDIHDPDGQFARQTAARQPDLTERVVVQAALATLAPDERRLLEGAFFDGLTYEDLAERAGLPLGSVKSRIRRALIKLRGRLEP